MLKGTAYAVPLSILFKREEQLFMAGELHRTIKRVREHMGLYVFLFFPLASVFVFSYIPMGGVVLAFKDYSAIKGILGSEWVGFRYFEEFIGSYKFVRTLNNTILLSFYGLFASFPIPIVFALLLNASGYARLRKLTQTITYMPHFISTVVMVGLLMQIFDMRIGVFGIIWYKITGEVAPNLFSLPNAFPHLYVWSGVWQSTGWNSIIYFAALSSVDKQLHEAAQIDGASRFQRVLHIDLPCILPTASIMLIMAAGRIMNVGFEKVFLMQNSMNIATSEVISTYVYKVGMVNGGGNFSFGTAVNLFNSLINFSLMVTVNKITAGLGGNSLW